MRGRVACAARAPQSRLDSFWRLWEDSMTASVLCLTIGVYGAALLAVAYFTRATARRIAGALAGGAASAVLTLAVDAFGEEVGWWHFAFDWRPGFLVLLGLGWAVSVAPVFLVTWRLARRFGWRGPAVVALVSTVIGPPRDYAFLATHPSWGSYGPGVAPVLAIAFLYALLVPLGQWVMGVVAGPSRGSRLAVRPWEKAARLRAG
jgi:hypothetical protein